MVTIKKNSPYYTMCYDRQFNIYFVIKKRGYVAKLDDSDIGLAFDIKTHDITETSTGKLVPRSTIENILGRERWGVKDIELITEQFTHKYGEAVKKYYMEIYPQLIKQAEARGLNIYGEYKNAEVPAQIYRDDIGEYISSYKVDNISDIDSEIYSAYEKDAVIITNPTFIVSRKYSIDIPHENTVYTVSQVK